MKTVSKAFIKSTAALIMFMMALSLNAKSKKTFIKKVKKAPVETVKEEYPKSIVALSPAATEILYAIGAEDQIAAVSEFSDYPPEAAQKPVAGGFDGKTLSIETILSFQPDFVYLTDGMHNFLTEPLDEYGIKWYMSKADSIEAIIQEITDIGKITGHETEALAVVTQMNEKLSAISKIEETEEEGPVSIYYEVWNAPFMTAGASSFINDVIVHSGAVNIFADLEEAYPMISEEALIARAPEVILLPRNNGVTAEDVKNRAGWESIPAVINNRIYVIDDNLYSRPGPRIADVVLDLSELIK